MNVEGELAKGCPWCDEKKLSPFTNLDVGVSSSKKVYISCTDCHARGPAVDATGDQLKDIEAAVEKWCSRGAV